MIKADKETLKRINKQVILNRLRKSDLSRTELAEVTNLSHSTVGTLVSDLINENIIFEKKVGESSGGRKPVILSINPSAVYSLLVIMTPKGILTSIVDLKLNILYMRVHDFNICCSNSVETSLLQSIEKTLNENSALIENIIGIGVSIPGLVDHLMDKVLYSSLLNISDFDIKGVINTKLKKNVHVFKDTDVLMLGEYILNSYNDIESYLYILVDSGVGLSFMNNGEILQLNRSGLQIGHIQLQPNGPLCNCGKYGCVEALVSEDAALRDLKEAVDNGSYSYDNNINIKQLKLSDVVAMSNKEDELCRKILLKQGEYLGMAIAVAINIFAPNVVLIGGPLSEVKWQLSQVIKDSILKHTLKIFNNTKIEFTSTGYKSCFIGMASRIFDKEFFIV